MENIHVAGFEVFGIFLSDYIRIRYERKYFKFANNFIEYSAGISTKYLNYHKHSHHHNIFNNSDLCINILLYLYSIHILTFGLQMFKNLPMLNLLT
jgi:hypothetical protein